MEGTKAVAASLLGASAAVAAIMRWRMARRADLSGQVALVTGASRGLGLLIARELAARGARLVICARHGEELRAAQEELRASGAEVLAVECDLANRSEAEGLVDRAASHFGRLDMVVNNAGIIQVGPLAAMGADDFDTAVQVMVMGPVHVTLRALPHLRAAPAGRIVNITSIGGKVAVPHLVPYGCAKFALVGFSEGLRAELAGEGIRVTTVVPGLMRTGSHLRALFAGQAAKEYSWFAAAASAPLLSMDARRAAQRIVDAAVVGRGHLTLTLPAMVGVRIAALAPGLTGRVAGMVAQLLPSAPGRPVPGRAGHLVAAESPSRTRAALTALGRRAAERLQPAVTSQR